MENTKLPNPNNKGGNADENKDDKTTALEKQVSELSAQIKLLNEEKASTKTTADAAKEAEDKKAEKARQDQLDVDADLRTLLSKSSEDDHDKGSGGINDLTNKELVDVIGNAVNTTLNARLEQTVDKVGENLDATNDNIRQLSKVVGQMLASQGVEKVKSDHPDFETYRKEIAVILQQYPNISIDAAYYMAKGQKVGDSPAPNELDMERSSGDPYGSFDIAPDNTGTTRSDPTMTRSQPKNKQQPDRIDPTHGILAFRTAVKAAADKVVNARR